MNSRVYYPAGSTDAIVYAARALRRKGCAVACEPGASVTHLMLDIPSFASDGSLRGGGSLDALLASLPESISIIGGNLAEHIPKSIPFIDLLQDHLYLAQNAGITAHCALQVAMEALPVTLDSCPVFVVGWGRIGKCLAALLKQLGANVAVYARKETDRAILSALGYTIQPIHDTPYGPLPYRAIFNTVPAPVLTAEFLRACPADCVKIELASTQGFAGSDVIVARGLPGKYAPESSGELIARTILRL